MPMYEFQCYECGWKTEQLRTMNQRNRPVQCHECGDVADRIMSVPTMHVWNKDRTFPNVVQHGDGSRKFDTKHEYEMHLKENHQIEVSHTAPVKRPHSAKVTKYAAARSQ